MTKHAAMVLTSLLLVACPKSGEGVGAGDAGSTVKVLVESGASGEAGAGGDAAAASSGASRTYVGKYSIAVGAMYVPEHKDWASVKFKNDESKLLGDGEIKVMVDASGRVSGGTEGGPLGASLLDGTSEGKTLSATLRRKDPADDGLTGTLEAKVSGDSIEGTMRLAESNAAVVRVGKLQAKKP